MTWLAPAMVVVASAAMIQEVGVAAAAFIAVTGGLTWIAKRVHQLGLWLHEVNTVVTRELTPNDGGSMKDQVAHNAVQVGAIRRQLDAHLSDVAAHVSDPSAHRRSDCPDLGPAGPRP